MPIADMSDFVSERPTPSAPSEAERLIAQSHQAFFGGNHAEAQRLSDQARGIYEGEEARANSMRDIPDPGEALAAHEPPTPPEPEIVTNAVKILRETEGGQHLVAEWGEDMGSNLAYARDYAAHLREQSPELFEKISELRNDPNVIREAARLGRLYGNLGGTRR